MLGGLHTLRAIVDPDVVMISTPQYSISGLARFRSGLSLVRSQLDVITLTPPPFLSSLSDLQILYPGIPNEGVCLVNQVSHSNKTSGACLLVT